MTPVYTGLTAQCREVMSDHKSELDKIEIIKDLGVTFDNNKLKFDHHINNIINKAYQILGRPI